MAGDIKGKFGANSQALTITLASLGSTSARASTAIDNSSNVYEDILFFLKVKSGASSTSTSGVVNVYAVGSVDGGTTYGENATGSDAGITLTSPPQPRLIGQVNVVANATTYYSELMSVAAAFGGRLPQYIVIIIENRTGGTLDGTEGNHAKLFQGCLTQYT
jgi:hypothetical protein